MASGVEPTGVIERRVDLLASAATDGLDSLRIREPRRRASAVHTGVVLAAGRSERLSRLTGGRSKMLQRLGGVSLVERAVRSLLDLGIERVVVVTGHDATDVAAAATHAGERVDVVFSAAWQKGNGASLAAARPLLTGDEPFLLVCGDHAFSEGALIELAASPSPAVLVDAAPSAESWAEGTKVLVVDGLARSFSKARSDPRIDAGAFVVSAEVFACYDEGAAVGDHSLAGAVSRLAAKTPMRVITLGQGSWWQDVDTPNDLRAARTLVRRSLGKESDGAISRHLNRPVSTRITMAMAGFEIARSIVSVIAMFAGLWAAWSLSAGRGLVGGLLVQAASIVDGVDGETARLRGEVSTIGALVDALGDRMVDAAIVAGLWLWAMNDPSRLFRITAIACSAIAWGVAAAARARVSVFEVPRAIEPRLIAALGGRDARMLVLCLGSMANAPIIAFVVAITMFLASATWRVAFVLRDKRRRTSGWAMLAVAGSRLGRAVRRAGRILVVPAVLSAVFLGVLPRLTDLDDVWHIVRSLSWRAGAMLVLLAAWNVATYWPMLLAAMPGLSLRQAAIVSEASTAVAMTAPAGGALAVGMSYAMYSSWGFSANEIAGSAFATFVANMSFKLLLPGISLAILFVAGERTAGLTVATLIGVAALVATGAVLIGLLWSERFARLVGDLAGRIATRIRTRIGRSPVTPWAERLASLRGLAIALLRDRWRALVSAEIVSQLSVFLVLLASMRVLGIGSQQIGWEEALAVFAVVRLASAVPIVPGNVGLAELGYIGGLTLAGGDRAEVVASVLLFRFLTYFAQIPIGGLTYFGWRLGRDRRFRPVNIASTPLTSDETTSRTDARADVFLSSLEAVRDGPRREARSGPGAEGTCPEHEEMSGAES